MDKLRHKRILVVDDEESIRESLAMGLEEFGWKASHASSAAEALDFDTPFDCYILDLSLPDQDGFILAGKIRDRFKQAPVVIFSGYLNDSIKQEAKANGIDAVMKKPFRFEEVNKVLASVIKNYREH